MVNEVTLGPDRRRAAAILALSARRPLSSAMIPLLGAAGAARRKGSAVVLSIVLTLDYEVYGTGVGDPDRLMIGPTRRLLDLADAWDVPVTLMPDVAQLLAWAGRPESRADLGRVEGQLLDAIRRGHDVQLHLHPAWFNAHFAQDRWWLDFTQYGLPGLPAELVARYVQAGADYLRSLLGAAREGYRCVAFRAGGWLIQPSTTITAALLSAGIVLDSSVFPGGHGTTGTYRIDFRRSPGCGPLPWRADPDDVARASGSGALRELPIYTRMVPAWSMATPRRLRLQRALANGSASEDVPGSSVGGGRRKTPLTWRYPKKFDFCRMTTAELVGFVEHARRRHTTPDTVTPAVAIGHSTEFSGPGVIERFFRHARRHWPDVTFSTLSEWAL